MIFLSSVSGICMDLSVPRTESRVFFFGRLSSVSCYLLNKSTHPHQKSNSFFSLLTILPLPPKKQKTKTNDKCHQCRSSFSKLFTYISPVAMWAPKQPSYFSIIVLFHKDLCNPVYEIILTYPGRISIPEKYPKQPVIYPKWQSYSL